MAINKSIARFIRLAGPFSGNLSGVTNVEGMAAVLDSFVGGGGSSAWGGITGTLSNQTDLQGELDAKQDAITGAATTIVSANLTPNRVAVINGSGKIFDSEITTTELSFLDGTTFNIQSQINSKADISHTHLLNSLDGVLEMPRGGTGRSSFTVGRLIYSETSTRFAECEALAPSRVMVTNPSSLPSTSAVTDLELNNLSGSTSNIQTQLNDKAALSHTHTAVQITDGVFPVARGGTGNNSFSSFRIIVSNNLGNLTTNAALAQNYALVSDGSGYITTSNVTTSELSSLSGITVNVQTQLNGKANSFDAVLSGDPVATTADSSDNSTRIATTAFVKSVLAGIGAGEINTASNLGAGTGLYAAKSGVDLQFKSLVAGSNISLSSDANTVTINATGDIGATWGSISGTLSSQTDLQSALNGKASTSHTHAASDIVSGILPVERGGTGQSAWTSGRLVYSNTSSILASAPAITAGRALVSTVDGLPTHANATTDEVNFLSGVTSAIQTQLNTKAPLASPAFTGNPTAPTQLLSDSSTKLATTAFVQGLITSLGAGESNTASNLGSGTGVFYQKSGVDLQFRSLVSSGPISISASTSEVTITSSAEANTASNLGSGSGLYASKSGVDLRFKSLVAGSNVTLTPTANDITIAATGEANTGSNLGVGTGIYSSKSGTALQFKSLVAGSNITISSDATSITINSTASGGTGSVAWGGITGTLSNQADLQTALNGKANASHTHAASDITSGTLAVARGGTGLSAYTANRLLYSPTSSTIANLAAITANRALVSDASGLPIASTVTTTEITYLSGVTSAIQTQLNAKAPLASPAFTGTPTAPTQLTTDNSTRVATTAYVKGVVAGLALGEVNTASNLGAGTGLYASKSGTDLRFKSLVAGSGVSLSSDSNTVTVSASASSVLTVAEKTANYTLTAADNGGVIVFNSASNLTLTVPSAFCVQGYNCSVIRRGAGSVTIVPSGVTMLSEVSRNKIAIQYGAASIVCIASNVFVLSGNIS
jgi:trimeric autotransporter adhesin